MKNNYLNKYTIIIIINNKTKNNLQLFWMEKELWKKTYLINKK